MIPGLELLLWQMPQFPCRYPSAALAMSLPGTTNLPAGAALSQPLATAWSMFKLPGRLWESWMALNPSTLSFMAPWHVLQSDWDGMSCCVPETFFSPLTTTVASVPRAFHLYALKNQSPGPRFQIMRVSTRTLSRVNSLKNLMPVGYCQKSMSLVSILAPAGNLTQRFFVAPSLQ